jgi:hypothetical protein
MLNFGLSRIVTTELKMKSAAGGLVSTAEDLTASSVAGLLTLLSGSFVEPITISSAAYIPIAHRYTTAGILS